MSESNQIDFESGEVVVEKSGYAPSNPRPYSGYLSSRFKRLTDVLFAILGLSITAALIPPVAIAIKLSSPGPVFYRQTRLGQYGKQFTIIKFRTMFIDAEQNGKAVWADRNDPRITRVGSILRRLYIDEFPQWWNVTIGVMSAVGPRPERPELFEQISEAHPAFKLRLKAKPGITGLAQTEHKYVNSVTGSRHKMSYDAKYIYNASFLLDLWIVVRTCRRVFSRQGT